MKKFLLTLLLIGTAFFSKAQAYGQLPTYNSSTGYYGSIWVGLSTNIPFRYEWENAITAETYDLCTLYSFARLDSTHSDGVPTDYIWSKNDGSIARSTLADARTALGIPGAVSRHSVTRSINSSTFTPSATSISTLEYYIQISCTASIGSNSSGKVELQYSTNGGSTWNTAGTVQNSNTVTLAIALNSVTLQTAPITASGIPANALCRLVPTTTGTATITYVSGNETY